MCPGPSADRVPANQLCTTAAGGATALARGSGGAADPGGTPRGRGLRGRGWLQAPGVLAGAGAPAGPGGLGASRTCRAAQAPLAARQRTPTHADRAGRGARGQLAFGGRRPHAQRGGTPARSQARVGQETHRDRKAPLRQGRAGPGAGSHRSDPGPRTVHGAAGRPGLVAWQPRAPRPQGSRSPGAGRELPRRRPRRPGLSAGKSAGDAAATSHPEPADLTEDRRTGTAPGGDPRGACGPGRLPDPA